MFGIPTEALLTLATTGITFLMERDSRKFSHEEQQFELDKKRLDLELASRGAVAKRVPQWVRSSSSLLVISTLCYGLLKFAKDPKIPISILQEIPQKSFLWVLKWGKTYEVLELNGFALVPVFTHMVATMVGYMFGRTLARRN